MIEKYKIDKEINGFGQLGTLCNGGRGSGDFGHYGRPGYVGGGADSGSPIRTQLFVLATLNQ